MKKFVMGVGRFNRRERRERCKGRLVFALFAVEEVVMGVGRFNRRERRERRERWRGRLVFAFFALFAVQNVHDECGEV
ncbi:MAG: hypothetical protein PHW08_13955 [Kiritimatiellae bacterium]|nr:hypothetical protein [Kiritimatiellia bacterium]